MSSEVQKIISEMVEAPNIDEYLRRDPATLTPEELINLVDNLRDQRARFIAAEEKKKAKAEGAE